MQSKLSGFRMKLLLVSCFVFLTGCLLFKNSKDREMLKDLQAYEFHHRSSNCQGRIATYTDNDFHQHLLEGLKKRGWKLIPLEQNKLLFAGELYFVFEKTKSFANKRFPYYKDCAVTVFLKKSRRSTPTKDDEILYKGSGYRNRPRITKEGRERCYKAIDEALFHIPYCVDSKEWERLEKIFSK